MSGPNDIELSKCIQAAINDLITICDQVQIYNLEQWIDQNYKIDYNLITLYPPGLLEKSKRLNKDKDDLKQITELTQLSSGMRIYKDDLKMI